MADPHEAAQGGPSRDPQLTTAEDPITPGSGHLTGRAKADLKKLGEGMDPEPADIADADYPTAEPTGMKPIKDNAQTKATDRPNTNG